MVLPAVPVEPGEDEPGEDEPGEDEDPDEGRDVASEGVGRGELADAGRG